MLSTSCLYQIDEFKNASKLMHKTSVLFGQICIKKKFQCNSNAFRNQISLDVVISKQKESVAKNDISKVHGRC